MNAPATKRARVLELAASTELKPRHIARIIGSTPSSVSAMLSQARKAGNEPRIRRGRDRRPSRPDETFRYVMLRLSADVYDMLGEVADERRIGVSGLCSEMLATVVEDGLSKALLED